MNDEERRVKWLALQRVPGAIAQGVAVRLSRGDAPGEMLAAAYAHPDEKVREVYDWARAGIPRAEAEIRAARRAGARVIDVEDPEYPARLKEIPDPPAVLFVKGAFEPRDQRAVAVIGSRDATRYGISVTKALVPPLVSKGVTIISGMARGIDSAGHRAAIAAGGRTIAVLGTGIDVCYPRESRDLYEAIPRQGAIISEVAPGTMPDKRVFPPRNRLISALSAAVVIVEAKQRSGTALTAGYAGDHGRPVGVVPGDVDVARSAGTNALLVDGAFVVRNADDVLAGAFGELPAKVDDAPPPMPPGLDDVAAKVWAVLAEGSTTLDALAQQTRLAVPVVLATVGRLEGAGLVRGDGWGRYETAKPMEAR